MGQEDLASHSESDAEDDADKEDEDKDNDKGHKCDCASSKRSERDKYDSGDVDKAVKVSRVRYHDDSDGSDDDSDGSDDDSDGSDDDSDWDDKDFEELGFTSEDE